MDDDGDVVFKLFLLDILPLNNISFDFILIKLQLPIAVSRINLLMLMFSTSKFTAFRMSGSNLAGSCRETFYVF